MTLNRWAVRRDSNEDEIVRALRRCGYRVWLHDQPLDLLVCFQRIRERGRGFGFLEIKVPGKEHATTPAQNRFFSDTEGAPRAVATSMEQAIAIVRGWANE